MTISFNDCQIDEYRLIKSNSPILIRPVVICSEFTLDKFAHYKSKFMIPRTRISQD